LGGDLMDAVSLALAKNYTNEKLNSLPSNAPTKTVTFDGGIYSVGSDVVNGQVSDVVVKGLTATNIISNGDFSKGTAGWLGIDAVVDGIAEKTATARYGAITKLLTSQKSLYAGHKLYVVSKFKASSNNVALSCNDGASIFASHSGSGNFEVKSLIKTVSSTPAQLTINVQDNNISDWQKFYVDYIFAVDLTATFGAGKEPTKEQCDQIFANWFDGTKSTNSVRIRSVNEDETKESIVDVNLPEPLRSLPTLPNGVKDEVNVSQGKRTQRVSDEYTINSDLISSITIEEEGYQEKATSFYLYLNIDNTVPRVTTYINNNAYIVQKGIKFSSQIIGRGPGEPRWNKEFPQYWMDSELYNGRMRLVVSLPHTMTGWEGIPTEQQVRDYFNANPATLTYQLAEPVVTKLPAQAPLQVFENGTVYVEPLGDPAETTLPSVELTVPIAGGNKVGIATHNYAGAAADWTLTNSESKCFMLAVSNAGGAANIIAPNRPGTMYAISNGSGHTITIKISDGNGVDVNTGKKVLVIHDGTDYVALTAEL
jgi:hypothetical protein